MKKNILLSGIFVLIAGVFNTLYKYVIFSENVSNYSTSFGKAFITTSKVNPNYGQIFLLSEICILIISILLFFIIYFINKKQIIFFNLLRFFSTFLELFLKL